MIFAIRPALLLLAAAAFALAVIAEPTLKIEARSEPDDLAVPRTNAERFARNLSPLMPRKSFRASRVAGKLPIYTVAKSISSKCVHRCSPCRSLASPQSVSTLKAHRARIDADQAG